MLNFNNNCGSSENEYNKNNSYFDSEYTELKKQNCNEEDSKPVNDIFIANSAKRERYTKKTVKQISKLIRDLQSRAGLEAILIHENSSKHNFSASHIEQERNHTAVFLETQPFSSEQPIILEMNGSPLLIDLFKTMDIQNTMAGQITTFYQANPEQRQPPHFTKRSVFAYKTNITRQNNNDEEDDDEECRVIRDNEEEETERIENDRDDDHYNNDYDYNCYQMEHRNVKRRKRSNENGEYPPPFFDSANQHVSYQKPDVSSSNTASAYCMLLPLPPNQSQLMSMNQMQLRQYLPQLIRASTGRGQPGWSVAAMQPDWWPTHLLPWKSVRTDLRTDAQKSRTGMNFTEALRHAVLACFEYYAQMPRLGALT